MVPGIGFNGSSSYIIASDAALPATTANRTLSIWLKGTGTLGADTYHTVLWYGSEIVTQGVAIGVSNATAGGINGSVFFSQYGSGIFSGSSFNDGNWHHLLATYDGTTWTVYVDNSSVVSSGALTVNTVLNKAGIGAGIGAGDVPDSFFKGFLAEARVYDYVLNSGQRTAVYNSGTPNPSDTTVGAGLVAYWKLNETSGTNFVDSGSGAHDGTGTATIFPVTGTASATATVTGTGQNDLQGSVSAGITVTAATPTAGVAASITTTISVGVFTGNLGTMASVTAAILVTPRVTSKTNYILSGRIRGG